MRNFLHVVPAKTGTHNHCHPIRVPAYAGTTCWEVRARVVARIGLRRRARLCSRSFIQMNGGMVCRATQPARMRDVSLSRTAASLGALRGVFTPMAAPSLGNSMWAHGQPAHDGGPIAVRPASVGVPDPVATNAAAFACTPRYAHPNFAIPPYGGSGHAHRSVAAGDARAALLRRSRVRPAPSRISPWQEPPRALRRLARHEVQP